MTNIANPRSETQYGFPQPTQRQSPLPIIANRAPTSNDTGYPIGQPWIYKNNGGYELLGVSQGSANWKATSGSGAVISVSGTSNQITATNSSGAVTLSLPNTVIAPGSISATTTVSSTTTMTAGTGLTVTTGNATLSNGNLVLGTAGNKQVYTSIASGTSAGANSAGTVTLVGGSATINTTAVTASSVIRLTRQSVGSTGANALGALSIGTITAGTSFVIRSVDVANATGLQSTDVSVIFWEIVN